MKAAFLIAVAFVLAAFAAPSWAVAIIGLSDPNSNSAELGYSVVSPFKLRVSLANTSLFDARITGFGFDIDQGLAAGLWSVSGTLDDEDWRFSFDAIPGPQDLEAFAITGADLWGGNTHDGIATAATGIFDFAGLFAANASLSNIVVRFQRTGPSGEGSDRGYACASDCDFAVQVAEPSTLALIGLGLAIVGLGAAWRRRR
jgi:hypothetical protein